jgi:sporulation protein YlmC with PRC-barrel domain
MLRSLKDLDRYTVCSTDGDIGKVMNFLLDDKRWIIRYLVVHADGPLFLNGPQVLISPISFRQADWSTQRFHLALTTDKVKNSPGIDMDKPVSRQHERDFFRYYGYSYYWGDSGIWGMGAFPGLLAVDNSSDAPAEHAEESGDIHLRSARELRGYHIQGSDEEVGHIEDFIVDDESWEIRYLVIDTSNWWVGKKVLVAPRWASRISWADKIVNIDLSRQAIKKCPEWNANAAVNREYETRLYDYYGRPVYWEGGDRTTGASPPHQAESQPGVPQPR